MNHFKIIRKTLSKLQNNKIKCTELIKYEVLIKFTSKKKDEGKIKVLIKENNNSIYPDNIFYSIIFVIPNDFDFDFVDEMLISKKVFKKLVYLFLKRTILLSILTAMGSINISTNDIIIEHVKNNLYHNEKKLDELFTKNSEILDRDDFKDIFEII